jgi:hypothetical protein
MNTISIAKDFTRFPSGRFEKNGTTSGEAFRKRFLEAPIARGESVQVQLDGTIGYGSSFLEEAFGGLVRALKIQADQLNRQLTLVSADPLLLEEVRGYIKDASESLE